MIDSHCHLADPAFAADLDDVVARALEAGVTGGLCVLASGDEAERAQAERVRRLWPELRFAVGVHPHQAGAWQGREGKLAEALAQELAALPGSVALGEIGLDYHYDFSPRDVQREVFRRQVAFARESGWPVIIHTREADEDTLMVLREEGQGKVGGIFHCFSGSADLARAALDLGFVLSFSGIVTFPRADDLRRIAAAAPADRLLVETDCPYLAPVPHRGRRNEPAWVVHTAAVVAAVRGVTPAEVAAAAEATLERLSDSRGAR